MIVPRLSFFEPVKVFVIMLAMSVSLLSMQTRADDSSGAELTRQIQELGDQGKYKEAIPLAERLVAQTRQSQSDQNAATVVSINTLAILYERTREYAKAEALYKEALEINQKVLGHDHPDTAASLNNLAELYKDMGDYAKAEPLFEEALEIHQKMLGHDNADTATDLNNLAQLYEGRGEYSKAEPLYKEALEIRQKVLGREHLLTAESLNNLAELFCNIGKYAKAEPLYKEALEIFRKVLPHEHLDIATSVNNLALLYVDIGEYGKAEPLLKEALETRQNVLGPEHPDSAASLNNLAALYEEMGEYAKAEPLYEEALEIRQKVLGREDPDTALSLNNLAALFWRMGEYTKAEPLYKEALEIREKVRGHDHPDTATSLNNLAVLYKDMGEYTKAEPLYKEASQILQKVFGRDHPLTASSLSNLAGLYEDGGEYAKAEPLYIEALEIQQKVLGPEHPSTAKDLNNLAVLYERMGEYAKAEPLYSKALEIDQKMLGRDHPLTALCMNNLALFYHEMGEYAKAEPLYKEALEIRQKAVGRDHLDTANSLNDLAGLYEDIGEYAKAEPLLKEALEIRQKALGRDHPLTALSLNNLARLYRDMSDYAKAESLLQEALEIRLKVLGHDHPDTAESLNNLAVICENLGEFPKAEQLLRQALEIRQKLLGPKHPLTASSLKNLAFLEFDSDHFEEGRRLAQLVSGVDLETFSQILSFGSEGQRLAYQRLLNPYSLFVALGESEPLLASAVLHYKGTVLDSIIEDRLLAETSKEGANRQVIEEFEAKKHALAQLVLKTTAASPQEAHARIQALEQEVESIQDKLARRLTDIGQTRRALTVKVEWVEAALPKKGVLVEYVRYKHYLGKSKSELRYGAVVLSPEGPPRWVALGNAKEVEATLKRYQRLVRNAGDEEMAAILQKIYNAVWKPVEQTFPIDTNRVIVSPDGELNFLSFATLLDPEKGFIAEKYLIQYVTSGRDLLREPQPTLSKQVIVMADPKFDRDMQIASGDPPSEDSGVLRGTEKRDIEDLSFEELEGTGKESAQLLLKFGHWGWQARSLSGSDVNKRALLDLHSPYILHLATHGFFEPEDFAAETNPNESQLPGIKSDLTKSKFFKNPMHRSGLALAGANTTIAAWKRGEAPPIEEDGILTAEDVSTLDLKGTWLVTLSACDTGSGEARAGEGVMGLRRGFVEAGAQNLLMSLWPISDEFTVQIMSDFYESAHQCGNAPEALAKVQRDWLVKLRKEQGLASAVNLAGPFIMSSQGKP